MTTPVLDYEQLYGLAEEIQQLCRAQLQSVVRLGELRYGLEVRQPGESRWLVIDLTPSRPFLVATKLTGPKARKPTPTPVLNFLKAHFLKGRLATVEIAQKPNRTIQIVFSKGETQAQAVLLFKCFPHGQHLILTSGGKIVNLPLRPRPINEEPVTFVEPEAASSWALNDEAAARFLGATSGSGAKSSSAPLTSPATNYVKKLEGKLIKAIDSITAGLEQNDDEEKISELQKKADRLKSTPSAGGEIQNLYDEIKKIKRKKLMAATRRNDLKEQLAKLRAEEAAGGAAAAGIATDGDRAGPSRRKSAGEESFSGTRVRLDATFELWVGRTDWQNDDLVRLAGSHELWIHLRDYPGAHGVIRGPKKSQPSSSQIEFACCVVAILSQKKKNPFAEGEKLDFIVIERKFVKKPKGAAPGRVTVEREKIRRVAFRNIKFDVT